MKAWELIYRIKNGQVKVDREYVEDLSKFRLDGQKYLECARNAQEAIVMIGSLGSEGNIESKRLGIILPPQISETDAFVVSNLVNSSKDNYSPSYSDFLYNYFVDENGLDYDLYDMSSFTSADIFQVLDYYLREKIGKLNREEQEMFTSYRIFDLEDILVNDHLDKPINHGNAGVVVITNDNCLTATVKANQHGTEIGKLMARAHDNFNDFSANLPELVRKYGDVLIQINRGELIIWLDPEISDYQKEQLMILQEKVREIEKLSDVKIDTYVAVLRKTEDLSSFEMLEETTLEKYVEQIKIKSSVVLK